MFWASFLTPNHDVDGLQAWPVDSTQCRAGKGFQCKPAAELDSGCSGTSPHTQPCLAQAWTDLCTHTNPGSHRSPRTAQKMDTPASRYKIWPIDQQGHSLGCKSPKKTVTSCHVQWYMWGPLCVYNKSSWRKEFYFRVNATLRKHPILDAIHEQNKNVVTHHS